MDDSHRISTTRWLHDRPLQTLQYIAAGGYCDEPDATHLRAVAATAAAELRDFIEGRTRPATEGLAAALADVVREARVLTPQLEIRLIFGAIDVEPEPHVVSEVAAATREALTNVRRHAGARRASVRCRVTDGRVSVLVSDDGAGFAPSRTAPGCGIRHSLVGRLRDLGGNAIIESADGGGTTVALEVLLQPRRSWQGETRVGSAA
jgi:signal transduction histidine kinase